MIGLPLEPAASGLAGDCTRREFAREGDGLGAGGSKADVSAPRPPTTQTFPKSLSPSPPIPLPHLPSTYVFTCLATPLARAGQPLMTGGRRTPGSRPAQLWYASASRDGMVDTVGAMGSMATLQSTKSSSSVAATHRRRQLPRRPCATTSARRTRTPRRP